ncbi:Uncharacterised protein [Achromobacter denitrificans]|nr:hypothetical protein BVK87_01790 [Achromobacter denitrificans]CAB3666906.1 hypothetical protein LMG1231_00843 [Achromobacter denitrificans]SUU07318.1 Uncharacterised protein [Achromobacter denitrificans]
MNDGLAGSRIAGLRKRDVAHKNLGRNSQLRIKCLPAKQRIDDRTISPDTREPEFAFAFAASQARRLRRGDASLAAGLGANERPPPHLISG